MDNGEVKMPKDNYDKKYHKKVLKRKRRRFILTLLLIFLAFYSVFSLAVVFYYSTKINSKLQEVKFYSVQTITYNSRDQRKSLSYADSNQSNNSYGLYISLSDLNKLCHFSVAGDDNKLTVIFKGSNEYMECFANSSFLYINGNPIRLSRPILNQNGYIIPIELIEDYIIGINIEYDERREVCTLSLAESENDLELKLKQQFPAEKLRYKDEY